MSRKLSIAIGLVLSLTATSPAGATVTVGQLGVPFKDFSGDFDYAQPTVTAGNSFVSPVTGTITSWSHNAAAGANQTLTMKVFRKVADPNTYMAVGHDGPRALTPSIVNTFPVSLPIMSGDVLGLNTISPVANGAASLIVGDNYVGRTPGLVDGASGPFPLVGGLGVRLNVTAVIVPTNTFTLGKVKRNTKKGTAEMTVDVPNPGELTASGKGASATRSSGARSSTAVAAPGAVTLRIKAKGKRKKTLNETGKVKLKLQVTFTPMGGDPSTLAAKVKLRKR